MKTLLLAQDFPPIGGGIARWMDQLARRYPAGELRISTGTPPDSRDFDRDYPVPIDRVPVPPDRLRTFFGIARWSRRAEAIAREFGARFVWCDTIRPTGYVASWLRRGRRVRAGAFLHGDDVLRIAERSRRSPVKRALARGLLARADLLVANSRWTAAAAGRLLAELELPERGRVATVPLGSDPAVFRPDAGSAPVARRHGLDSGRWLLTVARLVPHKGIDRGIEALAGLGPRFPGLKYLVVGDGPDRARLEGLARSLGVLDRVTFAGRVPDADLPALYATAEVYLGLSREDRLDVEGFGIAIADAAAAARPVVASRSGGIEETVADGITGLLVDPGRADDAVSAITALLDDPDRARGLGEAGRRRALEYLNWDRVVADLVALAEARATEPPAARR